jgi:hypothetical protein
MQVDRHEDEIFLGKLQLQLKVVGNQNQRNHPLLALDNHKDQSQKNWMTFIVNSCSIKYKKIVIKTDREDKNLSKKKHTKEKCEWEIECVKSLLHVSVRRP